VQNFRPPAGLGSGPPDVPDAPQVGLEDKIAKLAAYLHLEWCESEGTWRDLGHVDTDHSGRAGVIQALLEEEQYPTIG
jgi:hypothetical protein